MSAGRLRLCIVNPFQAGGGAELQISLLIAALREQRRFDVYYLARHIDEAMHPQGYRVVPIGRTPRVPTLGYVMDLVPLYRALRDIEPHVIYQRVACGYTGICALYARRRRTPLIWHVAHDTDVTPHSLDSGRNFLRRILEKRSVEFAIPRADRVVTQTRRQHELLLHHYGREADAVVANFHPEPSERIDKSATPTVVWIANLKPWKRPEAFIRLAQALRDLDGVRFLMLGAEPPRGKHERWRGELVRAIEAAPNLTYLGHRTQAEVNYTLARAWVFVNTSLSEGFPNTFIQAWLRDAAVVSLSVDPDSVLALGKVGIHAGTEERLAEAVRGLLTDPALRAGYAERGRAHAKAAHSLRNAAQLARLIETWASAEPSRQASGPACPLADDSARRDLRGGIRRRLRGGRGAARRTHLENARGHPADHRVVRNVVNDDGVGADDGVAADAHASEDLRARTDVNAVADRRRAERIIVAGVADRDAVPDEAVVADHGVAVNDDAAVMLDAKTAPDACRRADHDAAEDFGELAQNHVDDGPRRAEELVADHEPRVPEAIHEEGPESQAQQPLALGPEILEHADHRSVLKAQCR